MRYPDKVSLLLVSLLSAAIFFFHEVRIGFAQPARASTPEKARTSGSSDNQKPKEEKELAVPYKGFQPDGFNLAGGGVGFVYGLTDDSVGGFKVALNYAYRLTRWIWFDSMANFSFGGNCHPHYDQNGDPSYECGGVRGFGIDLLAGVQFKFFGVFKKQFSRLVPFVRTDAGVIFIVSNGPNDGVAVVARASGGFNYHIFKWFSVGGELGGTLGPAFRNDMGTGFFASVEVLARVEFFM